MPHLYNTLLDDLDGSHDMLACIAFSGSLKWLWWFGCSGLVWFLFKATF